MSTSAQLIDALLSRWSLRGRARGAERAPGVFPPGWSAWLAAQRPRRDGVTGDTAQHWVDVLAARAPVRPPRALPALNRWQAFATLWRQEWTPPAREDRRVRAAAAGTSLLVHLLFAVALVWIALVQLVPLAPAPLGEEIVMVEYSGRGTPETTGGGTPAPAAAQPTPSDAREALADTARPAPPATTVPTPALPTTAPDIPVREVPTPAPQNVVVSAPAPDPEVRFTLPPPTPRPMADATPALAQRVPDVATRAVPDPLRRPVPTPAEMALPTPVLQPREAQVAVREVTAPVRAPTARVAPAVTAPVPAQRPAATPDVATRDVPAPSRTPASASAARPVATPSSSTPASSAPATTAAARPAPASASAPGAGPRTQPAGARPSATRGDDWDTARRDVAGGTRGTPAGVFNPDGSVRLADRPGSASSGLPPGSLEQEIADLDRAGTWLRRAPPDYRGSVFDDAWRPSETLLEEWVRKSVTTVYIPIPGSKKKIVCKTVLLAVGGGCSIVDPDLNEQPARARPPPDIPFKPHLQDDNGAVKPAG